MESGKPSICHASAPRKSVGSTGSEKYTRDGNSLTARNSRVLKTVPKRGVISAIMVLLFIGDPMSVKAIGAPFGVADTVNVYAVGTLVT